LAAIVTVVLVPISFYITFVVSLVMPRRYLELPRRSSNVAEKDASVEKMV